MQRSIFMRSAAAAALALGTFPLAASAASVIAGPITDNANGHKYYLLSVDSWTNSALAAVNLGGNLVTINDSAENDFVFNTFGPMVPTGAALWSGFFDPITGDGTGLQHRADFRWVSGEPVTYTNWAAYEPNNNTGEYYGVIQITSYQALLPKTWNDASNAGSGGTVYGVVEVASSAPAPEPASLGLGAIILAGAALRRQRD